MKLIDSSAFLKITLLSSCLVFSSFTSVLASNKGKTLETIHALESADESAKSVAQIDIGESVEILEIEDDFYKVALSGLEDAFVLNKYIDVVEAEGIVVGDSVIVRKEANHDSLQLSTLDYGTKIAVTGIAGDFYRINLDGNECYVDSNYIIGDMIYSVQKIDSEENLTEEKTVYGTIIAESGVNLRKDPNENSEVVAVLARNSVLDVLSNEYDEWVKISFEGQEAYISSDYFLVQTGVKPDEPPVVLSLGASSAADSIIDYAKKFIGTPYSWGGTNLSRGVDCSGFVYAVMRDNGISLSRTSSSQANNGYTISKSELVKGDLVFFDTSGSNNGRISHVGIYIGDGNFIHSSSGNKWGITIDSLYSGYYTRTYVKSARVLN